jgi:hypothetical protein
MIEKVFLTFLFLVALFFVLMYPAKVVEFLQLFVNGAKSVAQALSGLSLNTK